MVSEALVALSIQSNTLPHFSHASIGWALLDPPPTEKGDQWLPPMLAGNQIISPPGNFWETVELYKRTGSLHSAGA